MIKKYNDYITIIIMYEQSIPFTAYAFIGVTTLIVTYSHLIMNSEDNNSEESVSEELDNSELKEMDSLSDSNEEENNLEDNDNSPFESVQNTLSNPNISSTVDTIPSVSTMPVDEIPPPATTQSNFGSKKKRIIKGRKRKTKKSNSKKGKSRKTKSATKRKYLLF